MIFAPILFLRDEAHQHHRQHQLREPGEEDRPQQHFEIRAGI